MYFSNSVTIPTLVLSTLLTLTGNISATGNTTITPTELSYIDGCTSNIQTQLDALPALSDNNIWTGTTAFNTSLPTSTITPTSSSQLVTKTYVDSAITGLSIGSYVDVTNTQTIGGIKTFTSVPLCATTATTSTQLVNKDYVDTSISNLVASAPSTLNTLNEIATALGNDPNYQQH